MNPISITQGVLLVDKPLRWTSHDVVAKVRSLSGIKTIGHTGTLDPLATGLLILLVGKQYTKRQSEFLKMDKEYVCQAQLGLETDTYDLDGMVVNRASWSAVAKISQNDLSQILPNFQGKIHQTAPAFSAVKIKGKKLYDLARQAKIDTRTLPVREITINRLELLDFFADEKMKKIFFTLRVSCSSGTYIRSLIHDVGQVLGVGACIVSLRRMSIGPYLVEEAIKLEDLAAKID